MDGQAALAAIASDVTAARHAYQQGDAHLDAGRVDVTARCYGDAITHLLAAAEVALETLRARDVLERCGTCGGTFDADGWRRPTRDGGLLVHHGCVPARTRNDG